MANHEAQAAVAAVLMNPIATCLRCQWDRLVASLLIGAGAMFFLSAVSQARGSVRVADQLSLLLSGGVGSLVAVLLGCGLLVSAGFHDEWRRLDGIEAALRSEMLSEVAQRQSDTFTLGRRAMVRLWFQAEWDRILGTAVVVAGLGLLIFSSQGAADSLYAPDQVAFLTSGGLGSLLLLAVGVSLFVRADLGDVDNKLSRIESALKGSALPEARQLFPVVAATAARGTSRFVSVCCSSRGRFFATSSLDALGVAAMVVGWAKAADAVGLDAALEGLVLAVAGLGVCMAATFIGGISIGRKVSRRARTLLAPIVAAESQAELALEADASSPRFWTAAGLRRFHERSCPALLQAGLEPRSVSGETDLEPCLLCGAGDLIDA